MSAALKLNPETESLGQKPRLGKKVAKLRLVWENPNLSVSTQKGKSKVKPGASSGRVVYNYFRYYDPSTGRYMTSDPIGLEGGLNTFGYVNTNPLRFIDLKGLIGELPAGDNDRRRLLSQYAKLLRNNREINDCIGFVKIAEIAAILNDNPTDFINDLQAILVGEGLTTGRNKGENIVLHFGQEGFKKKFKEKGRANQVQHAAAGLVIGHRYPWIVEQYVLSQEPTLADDLLFEATFDIANSINKNNFRKIADNLKNALCDCEP